jgi:DNA-binding LytR/AlgR family response regulator
MPHITGIDFMKSLEHTKPIFIFTTAYPQYALDGFELNAIDYLVKPIPFPRFLISVERAKEKLRSKKLNRGPNRDSLTQDKFEDDFIFVKSEYESLKILIDDIKYIQGLKDYLKIHTISSGAILTLMNFKDLLSKLPNSSFMRIHRSYVINISKIEILQRKKVIIDGEKIPIGESYKADFYKRIGL